MLPETHLTPCRRNLFAFICIAVIVFTIYSNTFDCSWHLDDNDNILKREAIHLKELTWGQIKKTLVRGEGLRFKEADKGTLYRPVACFSLALNWYFGQDNVFGYHLVNISIHMVASIFLFLFIYHTLNLPLLRSRYGSDAYFIALLSAVFWAINPVQTQAVNYIVQRMASLAGMFYIMSMYFYLKGRTSEKLSSMVPYFAGCVICALLAFGSKENTAMLPFSILLFDLFLIQGITRENIRKNAYVFLVLAFIPVVLALLLKGPSLFNPEEVFSYGAHRPFNCAERLLTEPRVILFYLTLLFYPMPQRLSISHDVPISHGLVDPPTTILSILVILAILAACVWKAKRWPLITYCIIFFFLNHVIEGSVFGLELIFEHRNYIPSMLLFVPVALLLVKGVRVYSSKRVMQTVIAMFTILLLIGLSHSTFMRNFAWKNDKTLWGAAAETAPNLLRPPLNVGCFYSDRGMHKKALLNYLEAAPKKVQNNKVDGYLISYNIGMSYQSLGQLDKAAKYYKKSLKDYPSYPKTHNNLGVIFQKRGLFEKAEKEFRRAISYDQDFLPAYKNLGLLEIKRGRAERSRRWYQRALNIGPTDTQALMGAGYASRLQGELGQAFQYFQRLMSVGERVAITHLYLGELYFKQKQPEAAKRHLKAFIRKGRREDLARYVEGYYLGGSMEEDRFKAILPYKRMVLKGLAQELGEWFAYSRKHFRRLAEKSQQ